jgi:hypothetical protein
VRCAQPSDGGEGVGSGRPGLGQGGGGVKGESGAPAMTLSVCECADPASQLAGRTSSHPRHGQDRQGCVLA